MALDALSSVLHDAIAATGDAPSGLLPARDQMALSLGSHIVLACFGVAFPSMIFVVHILGLRGNATALTLAKRWSKASAVLFAIGAVSGTVLSFEMGLLWPGLMGKYGDVLGLPFAFEGMSFFIEAIFLGIYLYGWGRMSPKVHPFMLLPMAAAGIFGTFCVLSVNAWMNWPTGFRLVNGEVTDVHPWRAMFNERVWLQFAHMWVGAFMVVGFTVAGVYAVGMLKGRRDAHHRLGFLVPFVFASCAALVQPVIGHVLGFGMDAHQPSKLAAFEFAETTTDGASPLRIGGVWIDGKPRGTIDIPKVGSLVAENSFTKPVTGMDTIPAADRPDDSAINIAHWTFQSMIGLGSALAGGVVLFWFARWRRRDLLANRWFLRGVALAGPAAILALEFGWTATEVGRQPWVVYGYLRTADAATDNPWLWWSLGGVTVLYVAMGIAGAVVLRSMSRRWREGVADLPSPYGPARIQETADKGAHA
ncbi:cytochrome ubiquinol oxidase subunit I [Nocardioides jejuensis]|nr:cytochrome ubiquinol oxidase subunit I [Nocardioides jejuensis]